MIKKQDVLEFKNSVALKGIMAIFIILAHLRNFMTFLNDTAIGSILTASGYLLVGMFFFLSGYGLAESFRNKENYCKNFVKKRIIPFYVDCLIFLLIYIVFSIIKGYKIRVGGYCPASFSEALT